MFSWEIVDGFVFGVGLGRSGAGRGGVGYLVPCMLVVLGVWLVYCGFGGMFLECCVCEFVGGVCLSGCFL